MRHAVASLLAAVVLLGAAAAHAGPGGVSRFVTLPSPGPGLPEGIAADAAGNIYVSTFDSTTPNVVYVFAQGGRLLATIPLPAGVLPIGLGFDAAGDLWVADFANGDILRFSPPFGPGSAPVQTIDVCGGAGAGCGLNALAFDAASDVYVSDSFAGAVYKIDLPAATISTFVSDPLLTPGSHGFPGFGANGLAFDAAGAGLFIANTADDRILRYDIAGGTVTVFAESVNGADGIAFDDRGRLWVAANQNDEVVALNAAGRVVERRGSFAGIGKNGAPRGLLFPASLAITHGSVYVTNLALPLTPAVGDEPEEDVTRYTVSRFRLGK
jgi:sugar lactone lactonase YvrE